MEFVELEGFECLRIIENILLVFDDSCEENYDDKTALNWQRQQDTRACLLSMSNIPYSNKSDGHQLFILTHLTSFYSNHTVIFSDLVI